MTNSKHRRTRPRTSSARRIRDAAFAGLLTLGGGVQTATAQCVLTGTNPLPPEVELATASGVRFAHFTGAPTEIRVEDFPIEPGSTALLTTNPNALEARFQGRVEPARIPLFLNNDVPVVASGSVFLRSGTEVRFSKRLGEKLEVLKRFHGRLDQTVEGTTTCDGLSLQRQEPRPRTFPTTGQGFLVTAVVAPLFGSVPAARELEPGAQIFEIRRGTGSSGLFVWGTETVGAYRRVSHDGDLSFYAWIRSADLRPLPPGEIVEDQPFVVAGFGKPQLAAATPPARAKAKRAAKIRLQPDEKGPVAGRVVAGAPVILVDIVDSWANILPAALNVAPNPGFQFWIPASDLDTPARAQESRSGLAAR